jgi:hypothetical protein
MAGIDSDSLSGPVRDLLRAFDQLTDDDRRDFFSEIMRRTKDLEWPPLDEETINRIADESFLEYDNREAADAQGRSG